jgi:molecular chaperone Hsp33
MTDRPKPRGDDAVLPFQLDRADIRGRVARLDATLETILGQHAYPPAVSALVAEAALVTALVGQALKLRWKLSMQVRGDGPVRLIAADWRAPEAEGGPGRVRAYAGFDPARAAGEGADPFRLLGAGHFALTIDQGPGTAPYQGLTPLAGGSLASCAETYFAQSEQIATRFAVAVAESAAPGEPPRWRGGAVMLQHLPPAGMGAAPDAPGGPDGLMSAADVAAMGEGGENWRRVNMLLDTAEPHELIGPVVDAETLLLRLFHEEAPRVWPAQAVEFGCTCSRERVEAAMAQYSAKDLATMTDARGRLTADCRFCGAHYDFDPATLGFERGA